MMDSKQDKGELTLIRGIGAIKKRWLKTAGIRTLADLATASIESIAHPLRQHGYTVSEPEIGNWIAQARALAVQIEADAEPNLSESSDAGVATAWETIATLTVELQTRLVNGQLEQRTIAHHQGSGSQHTWSGHELDPLQPWLVEHLQAFPHQAMVSPSPATIDIEGVRILPSATTRVWMTAEKNRPLLGGAIAARDPFALEASLQFTGVSKHLHQIVYRTRCYARHLATGQVIVLGDEIANVPCGDNCGYVVFLRDLMLPQAGVYRLKLEVSLENAPANPACFKIPLLEVTSVEAGVL